MGRSSNHVKELKDEKLIKVCFFFLTRRVFLSFVFDLFLISVSTPFLIILGYY